MKLQKQNNTLMKFSDKSVVISEHKEAFKQFLEIYEKCGGKVNDVTSKIIHAKFQENGVSIKDAERAVVECYTNEQFMNFANVMKYIKDKPFNPEHAKRRRELMRKANS